MIDEYRALFNKAYKFVEEQKAIETPNYATYKFKDDVRILTCSPEVVENYLLVHRLSDYKNVKVTHEINISITTPMEILTQEVDPECKVFSLSKVKL